MFTYYHTNKQTLNKHQELQLFSLGYPLKKDGDIPTTLGELIDLLPVTLDDYSRCIIRNEVSYGDVFIFDIYDELIDNIFDALVTLREENII